MLSAILLAALLLAGFAAAEPVHVVVQLPTANRAELTALLARQADASSQDYRKWLTPADFKKRFGAPADVVAASTASLMAAGFTVKSIGPNMLLASGPPEAVSSAFNTTLVQAPAVETPPPVPTGAAVGAPGAVSTFNGSGIVAPAVSNATVLKALTPLQPTPALNLPPGVSIVGPPVVGQPVMRLGAIKTRLPARKPGEPIRTGFLSKSKSWAYWAADLRQAYAFPSLSTGINGTGRTLCNLVTGDFLDSDLASYLAVQNLPFPSSITRIPVLGGCTRAHCPGGSQEMTLDVSLLAATAPGAALRIYSLPDLSFAAIATGMAQIVDDNVCDVVNMSFGGGESPTIASLVEPQDAMIQAGSAQGITWVAASGDHGSNDCSDQNLPQPYYLYPCAVHPASNPYVTAVGGTNLVAGSSASNGLSGVSDSFYVGENSWPLYVTPDGWVIVSQGNDPPIAGGAWASGGGISTWYKAPAFQTSLGVNTASNMRTLPDISGMMGSIGDVNQCESCTSGYFVIEDGILHLMSGTSGSSPFAAAVMALWSQQQGVPRLGNVNYQLYARYAAERDPKASAQLKLDATLATKGMPPFNMTAALAAKGMPHVKPLNITGVIASKAASLAAVKPAWAPKLVAVGAELTALKNKTITKTQCVTRQSAAGPLAEKVHLCAFNDDIPGQNGLYTSGIGKGGYNYVLGLGTVNVASLFNMKKVQLSGPWTVNATAITAVDPIVA